MKAMKFERKHFLSLGISFGLSLLVLALYSWTNIFDNIELLLLDRAFFMRDDRPVISSEGEIAAVKINKRIFPNIVIVGIDETAIAEYGQFPWNRKVYARFLERMKQGNPALLFFDIFFTEYAQDASADKVFFPALKAFPPKVIFDYPMYRGAEGIDGARYKDRLALLFQHSFPKNETTGSMRPFNNGAVPVPEILAPSIDAACAIIEPDADNKFRRVSLLVEFQNRLYPCIALSLARNYFKVPQENVEIRMGRHIVLKGASVPKFNAFGEVESVTKKDIVIPVDRTGQMMVNFAGYPYEFKAQSKYMSFSEAMMADPQTFDGKIVMLGAFAQGMAHDIWPTPHGNMYGIEINANALNTILMEDFLTAAPPWVNLLILLLLGLLLGFFLPRVNIIVSALITVALVFASVVGGLIAFIWGNTIVYFFAPLLVIVLAFAGVILYRLLTEEKEKAFIKKRFANYVNANVVEELLKNPKALELGGVNKVISVMFSDVRGFTTISEALGEPQKLVILLNEYLGAMTEIIFKYNGTLDKYVGDEIMAFWGAPVDQPDHPMLACRTALDQMWFLNNILNAKLKSEGKPQIDIGIGINSGIMTVGNMGSKNRMDYTLMGDNVNLGARLEGTNKVYGTKIIISEFTWEMVKDNVIVRELDNIKVKGKTRPVKIYELLAVKGHDPSALFKDGFLQQPG
jgi:adenylate cyclase